MPSTPDICAVVKYSRNTLPLTNARLSDEFYYKSLPLCVIDAVFSIGVRYESTKATVIRYCKHTEQTRIRDREHMPDRDNQESISSFCSRAERVGYEKMANEVYLNHQRTSPRGGILKAEAVLRFAQALHLFRVDHLQDVSNVANCTAFEDAIRIIPGQRSGISLQYFWMLSGSDDFIKPDRMVLRFLETALNRPVGVEEAPPLLRAASQKLALNYPHMTPRLLDHEIWKHQRETTAPRA